MYYKTYAEAKIANPDCEIVTTGLKWNGEKSLVGSFAAATIESFGDFPLGSGAWVFCNPADHCSTLKKFLEAGFKLVEGDIVMTINCIISVVKEDAVDAWSFRGVNDNGFFILSAAVINGGCKIPSKSEQWTIYNNTIPLCELTDEQAAMLFNAWRGGATLEKMGGAGWYESSNYELLTNTICRIKPKSERELFIEAACNAVESSEFYTRMNINIGCSAAMKFTAESMFDSGKFKYIDNTQHFGENI